MAHHHSQPSAFSEAAGPVDRAGHGGAPWSLVGDDSRDNDAVSGEEFTDLVSLAARVFDAPFAALAVGAGRDLRLVAEHGLPGLQPGANALWRAPRADALRLRVDDARQHAHFRCDPVVTGAPGLRFFLAIALVGGGGECLGVLGIGDRVARAAPAAGAGNGAGNGRDNGRGNGPGTEDTLGGLARLATRLLERHHLQRRNRVAAQIMQTDLSAVVVFDGDGGVVFVNHAAEKMFGSRARGMRGMPVEVLFPAHLQADPQVTAAWLHDAGGTLTPPAHLHALGRDGELRSYEAARCDWRISRGQGMALILRDVTEQLAQQERLRRAAMFDPLTGLANRNALSATLDEQLRTDAPPLGLLLFGLDGFKTINDTLGHRQGDEVLQAVAGRLQAALSAQALIVRFGGDEFAVVFADVAADLLERHLTEAIASIKRPYDVGGHKIHLDVSAGVAVFDRSQEDDAAFDADDLIARADLALYKAKAGGGDQCCHFEMGMRREVNERRMLDLELRRAHAQGEFELHYQPQVDLGSGRIFGAEALLRWRHPERGLLPPAMFIDALAASPLAADVGSWIIRQACHDAATWPSVDDREIAISVNLFPVQLNNGQLHERIDLALASSGLAARRLELEITETIALRPDDATARSLAGLRHRGVRLAFDDFGTGYASLSILQRFPIDRVKIDRSFVHDMLANHGDAAIVRSILLISHNLELQVIAEGVESLLQADMLRGLGCQGAQGYLYAPALSPPAFRDWLQQHAARPAVAPDDRSGASAGTDGIALRAPATHAANLG